jgi:hypothetical protein
MTQLKITRKKKSTVYILGGFLLINLFAAIMPSLKSLLRRAYKKAIAIEPVSPDGHTADLQEYAEQVSTLNQFGGQLFSHAQALLAGGDMNPECDKHSGRGYWGEFDSHDPQCLYPDESADDLSKDEDCWVLDDIYVRAMSSGLYKRLTVF